ncbi:aminotransferase class I/II-fold pyridoxal phosphate-dependent enzyme [Roseiterribacter gracilis]|uniref:Aminotransferase n=1 Tax=Roseiterribacter gracilis TaxID=2812848 RepID=A0A8S8XIH2_9PROT|nr:aminotransferase [Rhodospirillales bacterium TMPK1]
MFNPRLVALNDYPFTRLARLLSAPAPESRAPLALSVGEPQHAPPALLADTLAKNTHLWGKYPPQTGTLAYRKAVAGWLARRYGLQGAVDPDRNVIPVAGTREALFQVALLVATEDAAGNKKRIAIPNPSYAVYEGAARLAGADLRLLNTTPESGFLPDLHAVADQDWARTALLMLCTPSNPEGAVADRAYLAHAIKLARKHGFLLAVDECYAEIWDHEPPPGALEVAASIGGTTDPFANVLVFHSLSKRSSAAGLRAGFVAGDAAALELFLRLRNFASGGVPLPVLEAATALWNDEKHVEENRSAYRAKFDLAEKSFTGRFGFQRPGGGFFLWLDVGDGERAAKRLWTEAAIRTLPGAYMARTGADGRNHAQGFLRVALVHDLPVLADALPRMAALLEGN